MSAATNLNANDYRLINFNVPNYLIKNFDNLVRFKRVSRTSILISMMESYLRSEYQKMKDDDDLNHLINDIEGRNRSKVVSVSKEPVREWSVGRDNSYYPPTIPSFNDFRDEENFKNELDW